MISVVHHDRVCHVHLNNNVNKLSHAFSLELSRALMTADRDPMISAIIVTGSDKAFSVGAALDELIEMSPDDVDNWLAPWEITSSVSKPIIMALDGYVLGGGLEIALMGDILIATDQTFLGQPEIKLALLPGCGGTLRLVEAIGYHRAFEMCALGEMIPAEKAYAYGLINSVVKKQNLLPKAFEIAHSMSHLSIFAIQALKKVLKKGFDQSREHEQRLELERRAFKDLLVSQDAQEGLHAFMEKRSPVFNKR